MSSPNETTNEGNGLLSPADSEQQWGRVLICGGTDWPKLGRKASGTAKQEVEGPINPDLLEPHILRSLVNIKVVSVHTSCSGCHFVALDTDGDAWLFGRNQFSSLGVADADYVSENAPRLLRPKDVGAPKGTKFVHAACGKYHTLLVGSDGSVWAAGQNNLGQCGQSICTEVPSFKPVNVTLGGNKEHVIKASAGSTFSIVLTESGKLFSFGSAALGQLGNGTTGERITTGNKTAFDIETSPVYIKELDGKNIVDVVSGDKHSVALDETGVVYVWGYGGYCRLGLGNQADVLKPKVVPQFAGPEKVTMGTAIAAGPSNSVVVDGQGMYWMAGKWKNSGEGSGGSPFSSFRFIQDIMGCKVTLPRSGGVTHWLVTPDEDGSHMTVCWGQNAANGELGLGPDEPKSSTKPTKNIPLSGVEIIDIAAGQNTTVLLAKPNDKTFPDLPRHPVDIKTLDACAKCGKDDGDPLACDKCDAPYHLQCLSPPLDEVPEGEWFCPRCEEDPGAPIEGWGVPGQKGKGGATGGKKRKLDNDVDDNGKKPKSGAAKKKKQ